MVEDEWRVCIWMCYRSLQRHNSEWTSFMKECSPGEEGDKWRVFLGVNLGCKGGRESQSRQEMLSTGSRTSLDDVLEQETCHMAGTVTPLPCLQCSLKALVTCWDYFATGLPVPRSFLICLLKLQLYSHCLWLLPTTAALSYAVLQRMVPHSAPACLNCFRFCFSVLCCCSPPPPLNLCHCIIADLLHYHTNCSSSLRA